MIPRVLRISGFLSYQEPSEIDLSRVGLACISGLNGAGKSSLLDAITWVLFGEARRRDDSVINSHSDAATVSLDFEYEDLLYRVQRVRPRGKTTQLEFLVLGTEGEWKPLTEATVSRTQEQIARTLHLDYDTFINASFFLQGRADQFAQQTPGDRKRILAGILGLDEWERYRETTLRMIRELEKERAAQTAILQETLAELGEEDSRRDKLDQMKASLAGAGELRKAREQAYETAGKLSAALQEQRQKVDVLALQAGKTARDLADQRSRLEEREAEEKIHEGWAARAEEIENRSAAWKKSRQELEKWDALADQYHALDSKRAAPRTEIETERARLEAEEKQLSLLEQAAGDAQKALPDLRSRLAELQTKLALLRAKVDDQPRTQAELSAWAERRAALQTENNHLREMMDELKTRKDALLGAKGAHCPTCGKDLADDERDGMLGDLEREGKSKADQYRANESTIKTLTQSEKTLEEELKQIRSAAQERESLQQEETRQEADLSGKTSLVEDWDKTGMPRLAQVRSSLETGNFALPARQILAALEEELESLGYDPEKHRAARLAEQDGRKSEEEQRALEKARSTLEPLTREIETLKASVSALEAQLAEEKTLADESLRKYEQDSAGILDLDTLEAALREARESENRLARETGAAQQSVDVLATLKKREIALQAQLDEYSEKQSRLKVLDRAFSREGLPAMLIEQAIPAIETRANELLDRLSDGSMSIHFDTQKEYKDKKREDKKETLDILINDPAGTREYELYSGGEAFRINFAIRLALSHLLAQRAGARLRTLVIDEGFGSQDAEGRQRLVEAINQVKPDFALILVITHLEELKDSFPNRIEVEKTPKGSRVKVIAE